LATKAVFLDALGTLVELEPPWVTLRSAVPAEVGDDALVAAVREEMAYYKEHAHEGRDTESLADLRRRCAALISDRLGVELSAEALVESIVFRAYPDAEPALADLRARGLTLVVVSNWDCSLGRVLDRCGIAGMVDGVVTSAESGHRKPDPGIFASALELAGCEPSEALHVGDTPEEDGDGARAAGIPVVLVDRDGGAGEGDRIPSLGQIVQHLRR
jgi:putative hydrolase of the HAD superfamily